MENEISITQLAQETGYKAAAIFNLVKRGYLPEGRIVDGARVLPIEARQILLDHEPGTHWVKGKPRPGKRKENRQKPQPLVTRDTPDMPLPVAPLAEMIDWSQV